MSSKRARRVRRIPGYDSRGFYWWWRKKLFPTSVVHGPSICCIDAGYQIWVLGGEQAYSVEEFVEVCDRLVKIPLPDKTDLT